jgi:hypothetical protein
MKYIRRFGAPILTVAGVSLLIVCEGIALHYSRTRPHAPQPEAGRTIPFSNHGPPVFLTEGEDALFVWMFDGGVACLICGGLLSVPWRKRN